MARKSVAIALLGTIAVGLLVGAGIALAGHCGAGSTDDFNGNCESGNQVDCAQPVGASMNGNLQGEVSLCSDSGFWQGRVYAYTNRPEQLNGGLGAGYDGDADDFGPLQGWYRVSWFPQLGYWIQSGYPMAGYIQTACGAGDSWAEAGTLCGPQVQFFPKSCGPGAGTNDFNQSCEDGAGHVHCGNGLLPRGTWGQAPGGFFMPENPTGASLYQNGAAEVSACNDSGAVYDGRVYVAHYNGTVWAAVDGDPSDFGPLAEWRRVSVGSGGVSCRRGSGDSFYEAGASC